MYNQIFIDISASRQIDFCFRVLILEHCIYFFKILLLKINSKPLCISSPIFRRQPKLYSVGFSSRKNWRFKHIRSFESDHCTWGHLELQQWGRQILLTNAQNDINLPLNIKANLAVTSKSRYLKSFSNYYFKKY